MTRGKIRSEKSQYDIGYAKPPVAYQFQAGNKEHLKRKKKRKSASKLFRDLTAAPVKVAGKNGAIYVSRMELVIKSYTAAALRGDVRAAATLLKIHATSQNIEDLFPELIIINHTIIYPGDPLPRSENE